MSATCLFFASHRVVYLRGAAERTTGPEAHPRPQIVIGHASKAAGMGARTLYGDDFLGYGLKVRAEMDRAFNRQDSLRFGFDANMAKDCQV